MKKAKRAGAGALLTVFLFLLLGGCGGGPVTDPVAELLDYLKNREYARIYKLLDPATTGKLTLAGMTDRYEAVYSTLDVTDISAQILTSVALDGQTRRATVMLTYATGKLGELNMGNEITMRWRGNRWYVVWSPSLILPGLEEGDELQLNNLAAQRGEIFDINGELLASNDFGVTVYTTSLEVKDPDAMARLAAPVLAMTETEILKKIDPRRFIEDSEKDAEAEADRELALRDAEGEIAAKTIILKTYPKEGLPADTEAAALAVEGLHVDRERLNPIRYYPYGTLLAHTLGYTSVITAEDLKRPAYAHLPNGTYLGRAGLESAYDEVLRGQAGYELAIYGLDGSRKQILASKASVDGSDLRLTVDLQYQMTAELLLQQHLTDEMSGCVIMLDPKTGAVSALASCPTYDVNMFSRGVTPEEWAFFMDAVNRQPLFNRATIGRYPPGSTFKPFVAGYGLLTGAITLDFAFDQSQISGNTWKPDTDQWVYPPIRRVSATRDPMNLYNALVNSDNIYFAYTALQLKEAGFIALCDSLGFMKTFAFDLPVATSRVSNDGALPSIKLLADSGYGQGELLISPIQMASTFGSLANAGAEMTPYLVAQVRRTENNQYVTVSETHSAVANRLLSPQVIETLQPMLRGVVTDGTAKPINVSGMEVHGKTGTAQIGADNSREIAWIIGYNTLGAEQKLVCVMVEVPADQGDVRNYIAKALFNLIKSRNERALQ